MGEHDRERLRAIARRAMLDRGLQPEIPPAALAEARAFQGPAAGGPPEVRDLRRLLWCSIDNDDSRDLDQLTVAEPLEGGVVKVLVAVADVDALVKAESAIDRHASINTTSVYTAAQVFPMLPERLSTDLTSLNPGEERLAVVLELMVAGDGEVTESEVGRALVFNHAKLAYDGVAPWLEGEAPPPAALAAVPGLEEQLRLQDRAAQAMRARRQQMGALALETREARPVFQGDVLSDLRADEKNRAKELIEDFMIGANAAATRFLDRKGFPSLRRVLRAPDRWPRIVDLARDSGESLPAAPDARALEAFLARRRAADPARFGDLSLAVVKLLGSGEYALELPGRSSSGHFGLAIKGYTHSTAPNRRYPDLATQRLLKAALAGEPTPTGADELSALARHCTEQEDDAGKVERQVRKAAAAMLLSGRVGERFEAVVTGASPKGTWVRIRRPTVEGKLVRGFAGLDVGDRVEVTLVHTDVDHGFIDFVRAER
jgi:VacB/RNase II family 3'-5' exoribonuclease